MVEASFVWRLGVSGWGYIWGGFGRECKILGGGEWGGRWFWVDPWDGGVGTIGREELGARVVSRIGDVAGDWKCGTAGVGFTVEGEDLEERSASSWVVHLFSRGCATRIWAGPKECKRRLCSTGKQHFGACQSVAFVRDS